MSSENNNKKSYDVIVVGARVAGSPLAMLLAKKGYKVLLLDGAAFPSDRISTHFIMYPGCALLKEWGLDEKLEKEGATKYTQWTACLSDVQVGIKKLNETTPFNLSLKRIHLDDFLRKEAQSAGAEFRQKCKVIDVIKDEKTAEPIGVKVKNKENGKVTEEYARFIVGADGPESVIADKLGVPKIADFGKLFVSIYSYFKIPRLDSNYGTNGLAIPSYCFAGKTMAVLIPHGDRDSATVQLEYPAEDWESTKDDLEGHFWKLLSQYYPSMYTQLKDPKTTHSQFHYRIHYNCLRQGWGSRWALAGDARCERDPITAGGITSAMEDAKLLANCIDDVLADRKKMNEAGNVYCGERNVVSMQQLEFVLHLKTLWMPMPELWLKIARGIKESEESQMDFVSVFSNTLNFRAFLAKPGIQKILSS